MSLTEVDSYTPDNNYEIKKNKTISMIEILKKVFDLQTF